MSYGYWLKERVFVDVTTWSHVGAIIASPETFGLTAAAVREAYARHREPIGLEGEARAELVKAAAERGWIRVRKHLEGRSEWVIVECGSYPRDLESIRAFLAWLVREGVASAGEQIAIGSFADDGCGEWPSRIGGLAALLASGPRVEAVDFAELKLRG